MKHWLLVLALVGCSSRPYEDSLSEAPTPDAAAPDEGLPDERREPPRPEEPPPPPSIERAERPPPALSGGTLSAGRTIVAADPDRDVIWLIDPEQKRLKRRIELRPGDEPGRVALHGDDAWIALRGSGDLVRIDTETAELTGRWPACASARGVAWGRAEGAGGGEVRIAVACAEGEVVFFSQEGAQGERVFVAPDLRDVVFAGDAFQVSRFRSAELITVGSGQVRRPLPVNLEATFSGAREHYTPGVAWRTRAFFNEVFMLHQRMQATPLTASVAVQYYAGGPCGSGVLHAALGNLTGDEQPLPAIRAVLPLDWDRSLDGGRVAVVDGAPDGQGLAIYSPHDVDFDVHDCAPEPEVQIRDARWYTSVAWLDNTRLVAWSREPAGVLFLEASGSEWASTFVEVPGVPIKDTGHFLFHFGHMGQTACASCHPEGGDDGHVWRFPEEGARRTQPLFGGVMERAPFHWDGSLASLAALSESVLEGRMGGDPLHPLEVEALGQWMASLKAPPPPPVVDPEAEARGRDVFHDPQVGCTDCHGADGSVIAASSDVGTGGAFQVPTLAGLAHRAPYMHDGCASTLADRFDPACGGDAHGAELSPDQLADLLAFLERL